MKKVRLCRFCAAGETHLLITSILKFTQLPSDFLLQVLFVQKDNSDRISAVRAWRKSSLSLVGNLLLEPQTSLDFYCRICQDQRTWLLVTDALFSLPPNPNPPLTLFLVHVRHFICCHSNSLLSNTWSFAPSLGYTQKPVAACIITESWHETKQTASNSTSRDQIISKYNNFKLLSTLINDKHWGWGCFLPSHHLQCQPAFDPNQPTQLNSRCTILLPRSNEARMHIPQSSYTN